MMVPAGGTTGGFPSGEAGGPVKAKPNSSKEYRPARVGSGRATQPGREDPERQQLCNELREERDQLRLEVAELRRECAKYLKALYALTQEDFDIDKKTLLAKLGQKPSLADFISELESQGTD